MWTGYFSINISHDFQGPETQNLDETSMTIDPVAVYAFLLVSGLSALSLSCHGRRFTTLWDNVKRREKSREKKPESTSDDQLLDPSLLGVSFRDTTSKAGVAIQESSCQPKPSDWTETYKDRLKVRRIVGSCHGTGELEKRSLDYYCDLEASLDLRGDNDGDSQPQAALAWAKPLSSDHRLSSQHVVKKSGFSSEDVVSQVVGNLKKDSCKSLAGISSFSRCVKVINVVCPAKSAEAVPKVFDIATETLLSAKETEDMASNKLCMMQLLSLQEGKFQCIDVTTCSATVTVVLQKASEAVLVFLFPIADLLGKHSSWLPDLRRVILNSGIGCQRMTPSATKSTYQTRSNLHVIITGEGLGNISIMEVKRSLRDQLGFTVMDHALWHYSKESKIMPMIESRRNDLLEILHISGDELSRDCEWRELENMMLKKQCTRSQCNGHQELVDFARRKYTDVLKTFEHMQRSGLLFYFPSNMGLEEETTEMKVMSQHPGAAAKSPNSASSNELINLDQNVTSGFFVFHLSSFSSHVTKLSDLCHSIDTEANSSLIPIATRRGLLPKSPVLEEEIAKFPSGFNHAVHRWGILIDPALCPNTATLTLPSHDHMSADTESKQFYLFPAALRINKLPPLHNYTTICPLAYKHPGLIQRDIPFTVFYLLIGNLMKYFPRVLGCGKHNFRFLVHHSHLFDIENKGYYIQIAVHVFDQISDSLITSQICKSMVATTTTCLKHVLQSSELGHGLSLEPSVLIAQDINSSDAHMDFADFPDSVPSLSNTYTSASGLEVRLPEDILYWYGRRDKVCVIL
jgi:hypothetical protein